MARYMFEVDDEIGQCTGCPFDYDYLSCTLTERGIDYGDDGRPDWCPLVRVREQVTYRAESYDKATNEWRDTGIEASAMDLCIAKAFVTFDSTGNIRIVRETSTVVERATVWMSDEIDM